MAVVCRKEGRWWPFSFPRWPRTHLLRAVHAVRRPSCATFVAAPLASDVDHALLSMTSAELSLCRAVDSVRRSRDATSVPAPLAPNIDHIIEGMPRAKLSSRGAVTPIGRSLHTPSVATLLHHPGLPSSSLSYSVAAGERLLSKPVLGPFENPSPRSRSAKFGGTAK